MLTLTRTTKTIVYKDKILSEPFIQVLPLYTNKSSDEAISELIKNRIIKNTMTWFASGDYQDKASNYFPQGSGEYKYKFVDLPQTEKRIMILGSVGFDDYYNDEYTRSGDCEFFVGPFANINLAKQAARDLMDEFIYENWAEENEVPVSSEYTHHCEGQYISMKVVEIDVIA